MRLFPLFAIAFFPLTISINFPLFAIAAELAEIENRGKITIAVKDNLRPLGYKDDQDNLIG